MDKPKPPNKDGSELNFQDFSLYPIWGFVDDDGDEVMPVNYEKYLLWSDGGEALFISCEFTFNDGSTSPGVVYVRMTNQTLYVLVFPEADGKFFEFPINSRMEGDVTHQQLALHLHKSIEQIFPITYTTPYVFKNGEKLIGKYSLPNRLIIPPENKEQYH